MINAQVSEVYINFVLMYKTDHIFPTKDLINKDGKLNPQFIFTTGMKPSISHFCVLFFPCVVRKATSHVGTKALNMCHQGQNCFHVIFVGITKHQKGYLVYVPQKRNIVSSYNVVFDKSLSSALEYMSQPYA